MPTTNLVRKLANGITIDHETFAHAGTCLRGYLTLPGSVIETALGAPNPDSGEKVGAEWVLILPSGAVVTIYDWCGEGNEGAAYAARSVNTNWHLGAKNREAILELGRVTGWAVEPTTF